MAALSGNEYNSTAPDDSIMEEMQPLNLKSLSNEYRIDKNANTSKIC